MVSLILMSYPLQDKLKDEHTLRSITALWYDFFKDDDLSCVLSAVRQHINTSRFIPTIADIRMLMTKKRALTAFSDNDYASYNLDRMERFSRGITDKKYAELQARHRGQKEQVLVEKRVC